MANVFGVIIVCLFGHVMGAADYSGYKVYKFLPEDTHQVGLLNSLEDVDFWRSPSGPGEDVLIMFSPSQAMLFDDIINSGIPRQLYVDDVGSLIDESMKHVTHKTGGGRDLDTDRFYTKDQLYAYLEEEALVCGSDCEIINIGSSSEGTDLNIIKISRPGTDRRAIWIDAGVHAREWLTPAVASYFVDRLINDYGVDPEVTQLRDSFDWYINTLVNPDGYDYTWTTDRMWRKTRSINAGSSCVGTDGNRNYDFQWDLGSTSECSETYRGDSPESETEILSVTSFVTPLAPSVDLHVSFHTFGQILLRPWGYTQDEPADSADLDRLGQIGVDAINANSDVIYELGKTSGSGSGLSMDWAKGAAGIKYSYLLEMRDEGQYGFIAPPEEILPTCVEVFAGISAMALDLAQQL